jgi:hypothetical protein
VSTHYLVSMFNDEINDVVVATGSPPTTPAVGNYIVRVPDDAKVCRYLGGIRALYPNHV